MLTPSAANTKSARKRVSTALCAACAPRVVLQESLIRQVAELARRLTGKYLAPKSEHLEKRVEEIREGKFEAIIESLMQKPIEEMKELYNHREIEK